MSGFLHYGPYEGTRFYEWMRALLDEKGVRTFADLAVDGYENQPRYRSRLQVIASDVTTSRLLVLPRDAKVLGLDPDSLEVALAVRMSMSIPLVFEPVLIEQVSGETHVIVDGTIFSNYPVWLFDCEAGEEPHWPTFGALLVEPQPRTPITDRLGQRYAATRPLTSFLTSFTRTLMETHDRLYVEKAEFARTIAIPTLGVSSTEFDIPSPRAHALYEAGRVATEKFLSRWNFDAYVSEFRTGKEHSRRVDFGIENPYRVSGASPERDQNVDLLLEGGGVKGIALAGAFSVLEERGYRVQHVAGTSGGAMTAALIAAGFTSSEIKETVLTMDFREFRDTGWEKRHEPETSLLFGREHARDLSDRLDEQLVEADDEPVAPVVPAAHEPGGSSPDFEEAPVADSVEAFDPPASYEPGNSSHDFGVAPQVDPAEMFEPAADESESSSHEPGEAPGAHSVEMFEPPAGEVSPPTREAEVKPRDPPRSAFGLLHCPDEVGVGVPFELAVGLARDQEPGVAGGPLVRPASSVGPYTLNVDVDADGFSLSSDESWRNELQVTYEKPFPTLTLHLTAAEQDVETRNTKIEATFSVGGQTIGLAVRYIVVERNPASLSHESSAAGVTMTLQAAETAPDLTIKIRRWDSKSGGRLRWSVESPHDIRFPDTSESDIGSEPQAFALDLVRQMTIREGKVGMFEFLLGEGKKISRDIPRPVREALRAVATKVAPKPPTCLVLSEEPYVPWELAVIDPPLDARLPPFLATQAVVGRWILEDEPPPAATPPTKLEVREMVAVSGNYEQVPGWKRLEEAEGEAKDLQRVYEAQLVDAATKPVLDCLKGTPPAEILHFAVHGKYDPNGIQRGLALTDRQMLDSSQIEAYTLARSPFVFLNACQAGSGEAVLGDYAGLAAAFLYAGASGVIAPLWSIDDKLARSIAETFYEEVLHGDAGPADALARQRSTVGQPDVTSGTSLAYQFFGHPLMRLVAEGALAAPEGSTRSQGE